MTSKSARDDWSLLSLVENCPIPKTVVTLIFNSDDAWLVGYIILFDSECMFPDGRLSGRMNVREYGVTLRNVR